MFKKVEIVDATISLSQKLWEIRGWVMGILATSGSIGFLTFFDSKLGVAITCGTLFAIACFIALFVVVSVKKSDQKFERDLITRIPNQSTSLAFRLITNNANEIDFILLRDQSKNVIKHKAFPFLVVPNLGKCFDVILELKSPLSRNNVIVDVAPSNNKLHPKFNTIYSGNHVLVVRILVNNDLDVNGGEYQIQVKSYES